MQPYVVLTGEHLNHPENPISQLLYGLFTYIWILQILDIRKKSFCPSAITSTYSTTTPAVRLLLARHRIVVP